MESNLRGLYYFVVVAEEMNITRAAQKLYITQQSLSKHIKKLEEQYQVPLFDRKPTLRLTVPGEHLLEYAKRALQDEGRLFNYLQGESRGGHLRLRVGIPTQRGSNYLPDIYNQYRRLHPNVILSYYSYGFEAANTALAGGDIDLYFTTIASAGKFGRKLPIVKDELFFVVSDAFLRSNMPDRREAFLREHKYGITVAETIDFPLLLPPNVSTLRKILNARYRTAAHAPNVVMELTDNRVNFDMCARDLCASFISKSLLLNRFLYSDSLLYAIRVTDVEDLSYFGIVYPETDILPQYALDYIDCVQSVVKTINQSIDRYLDSLGTGELLKPVDHHDLSLLRLKELP